MSKSLILRPRLSEKAYGMSQENSKTANTYVFEVPKTANKLTVAAAVGVQFGVKVDTVNISVSKGKAKRSFRKRSRPMPGRDKDIKKAYVRLKQGETIAIFPAEETEAKPVKKSKKEAK